MKQATDNGTQTLYRFTSPINRATFSLLFESDDAALTYASEMVDGPQTVKVERWSNSRGDWFVWNGDGWIYDAEANWW